MSENEWRDDQRARIEAWWNLLGEDDKARMLALGEEDGDVPADLAESLQAARVSFVSTWRDPNHSDFRSHPPSELTEFLAEQREASNQ